MNALVRAYRRSNENISAAALSRALSRRSSPRPRSGSALTPQGEKKAEVVDSWTEVRDKTTGELYYWNERTGETTALGEPRPGPEGRRVQQHEQPRFSQPTVGSMGQMLVMGAGFVFAASMIRMIF
ncbi:hypothetical protein BSKO_13326 [Bryopsis sp. KO-2023]|nr:hypothetical protein BSKO_13326 [Bryopsis sp. KO-2023]